MAPQELILDQGLALTRKLGEGASAVVFAAEAQTNSHYFQIGLRLAVKIFRHPLSERNKERFERELNIGMGLSSPYLVRYLGVGTLPDPLGDRPYLVMEHLEGTSLRSYVQQLSERPSTADQRLRSILSKCLQGLAVLHAAGIIHRDVQPNNILINTEEHPVLLDFGTAKHIESLELTSVWEEVGTRRFWAPECLTPERARWWPSTDVFMLGSSLLYCLTGKYLFHESKNYPSFYQALARKDARVTSEFSLLPSWVSPETRFLIELMLNGDAAGRPSIETLLSVAEGTISKLPPLPSMSSMESCVQQLYVLAASGQVHTADVFNLAHLIRDGATNEFLTAEEIELACTGTSRHEKVNLIGTLVDAQLLNPLGEWFEFVTSNQWLYPQAKFSISARARRLEAAIKTSSLWLPSNLSQYGKIAEALTLSGTEALRIVHFNNHKYISTELKKSDIISTILLHNIEHFD